jgi:hypothetical protein
MILVSLNLLFIHPRICRLIVINYLMLRLSLGWGQQEVLKEINGWVLFLNTFDKIHMTGY